MDKRYKLNDAVKVETVRDILDIAVREAGDSIAFQFADEKHKDKTVEVTYKQFANDVDSLGTALASFGMNSKHVAIIGENSYRWLTVYLSMLKSTGVFVPIDRELKVNDVINVLKHSDSEALFYSKKYEDWILQIKKEVPEIKFYIGLNKEKNDDI